MEPLSIITITSIYLIGVGGCWLLYRSFRYAFVLNITWIVGSVSTLIILETNSKTGLWYVLVMGCPLLFINTLGWVFWDLNSQTSPSNPMYKIRFKTTYGSLSLANIKRGASIIGSAGSGKTESVVYGFLAHFVEHRFCGVLHDYKNFELTEMAYPLYKNAKMDFYCISFDPIYHRVNPIAPRYTQTQEAVNEISRVLIENLLEQKESGALGNAKFFTDAAEGLIGALIWKLKTSYPQYCTLPHLIALYHYLDTQSLIAFLESNATCRAMADAFISGKDSDRQTAGVKSTLSNALKKISSPRLAMALSADEVPLNINTREVPTVISVVNNPLYETAYSPVIATIIHTLTKQMSVREAHPSFLMLEEAPTLRLLNMHRIPATLRSYNIATIYVMQDKIQNDLLYGEKASRAILSNLSYQFFGKVNDPDTAKYYERFFEIIKQPTKSVSKNSGLSLETRITKGEKEVSKRRADLFFRLKQGEFIAFADGKDKRVQFALPTIKRELPEMNHEFSEAEITANYKRIFWEVRSIFME